MTKQTISTGEAAQVGKYKWETQVGKYQKAIDLKRLKTEIRNFFKRSLKKTLRSSELNTWPVAYESHVFLHDRCLTISKH